MPEKTNISKNKFFSRIFARYSDFLDVFPSISSNHQRETSFRHFFLLILLQNDGHLISWTNELKSEKSAHKQHSKTQCQTFKNHRHTNRKH